MQIHLEADIPAPPERVYELLTNGVKFGEATGKSGMGGGAPGPHFHSSITGSRDAKSNWFPISGRPGVAICELGTGHLLRRSLHSDVEGWHDASRRPVQSP